MKSVKEETPKTETPKESSPLASITTAPRQAQERIVLHGREGLGKTSFAGCVPGCIFIQTAGETGLETLIKHNRLQPVPHFPEATKWESIIAFIKSLMNDPHDFKWLCFDTLDGAESMLTAWVIANEYGGSTVEFDRWGRGSSAVIAHWRNFILGLDLLRQRRNMGIIMLSHSVSANTEDDGDEFKTWIPSLTTKYKNATTWSVVNGFADMVLYLDYERVYKTKDGKERIDSSASSRRVIYTESRPGWTAKNRHGMPPRITLGDDPKDAWDEIKTYL